MQINDNLEKKCAQINVQRHLKLYNNVSFYNTG